MCHARRTLKLLLNKNANIRIQSKISEYSPDLHLRMDMVELESGGQELLVMKISLQIV